ncbi:hypothetical protein RJ639_018864 [Escallonia herrerae]|uniref:Protein CLP1 homolog n=1 Tax=Escallonia herrerae TaxID=1293975 RepID=A0AA88VAF3_9ASTE|nr:hypothetical protein RJ639_018864 [Escallonia herrerae]
MAYGGAVAGPPVLTVGPSTRQVKLDKECELRVEVSPEAPLRLRILSGTAEIFGTEIPPEIWLTFPPSLKFAVFTWYGATIELDGTTETDYTADETPMISYVNVHAVLEGRRNRAKASPDDSVSSQIHQSRPLGFGSSFDDDPASKQVRDGSVVIQPLKTSALVTITSNSLGSRFVRISAELGPRVIVVGPTDSGKSTLSRMLLSWAAKQGWKPTYVDLDVGQGSITIPGCIAATPIEMPIDSVEGIPLEMPLVYYYGQVSPSLNADLYKVLVKELAQTLERQFAGNAESRAAGMVINTMGWIEGVGYEEKLCSMLKDVLKSKPGVDVVKLQKSGGVVSRSGKVRNIARKSRIREYFYGPSNDLSPHSNVANFNDLSLYRIGGGPQAPRSALPIGAEPAADPTRLVPVNINTDLLHLVLAVSFAKEPDQIISRYGPITLS